MKSYGYNFGELVTKLSAIAVIAAVFFWKEAEIALWIISFFLLWTLGISTLSIAKVEISEESISIRYISPFQKNLEFLHEDIRCFIPTRLKKFKRNLLIAGSLITNDLKNVMLFSSGTKDFEDLCEFLESIHPQTEEISLES